MSNGTPGQEIERPEILEERPIIEAGDEMPIFTMPPSFWGPEPRHPLNDVFWSRVSPRGERGCLEWTGLRRKEPVTGRLTYGQLRRSGRLVWAHRLSYEIAHEPIPDGLCVLHGCDNPPCVNPRHLSLGTRLDNAADRKTRGRSLMPQRRGKLTREQVIAIRADRASRLTLRAIALKYGISHPQVYQVTSGRSWKEISQ